MVDTTVNTVEGAVGMATASRTLGFVNKFGGLHEYCKPSVLGLSVTESPRQMVVSFGARSVTKSTTLINTESVLKQPGASVSVT